MENSIGYYIKKLRSDLNMTLKEFSEVTGLSTSYINQIEKNERTPSKQKLFDLIYYFNIYQNVSSKLPTYKMISMLAQKKKLDKIVLLNEFEDYKDFKNEKTKHLEEQSKKFSNIMENLKTNKIEYPTNHNSDIKPLDKPYFDLNWLLTQSDYHVFYGKKYHTDDKQIHTDSLDSLTYNKLSDEDKKMLKNIIDSIFENKYKTYGE